MQDQRIADIWRKEIEHKIHDAKQNPITFQLQVLTTRAIEWRPELINWNQLFAKTDDKFSRATMATAVANEAVQILITITELVTVGIYEPIGNLTRSIYDLHTDIEWVRENDTDGKLSERYMDWTTLATEVMFKVLQIPNQHIAETIKQKYPDQKESWAPDGWALTDTSKSYIRRKAREKAANDKFEDFATQNPDIPHSQDELQDTLNTLKRSLHSMSHGNTTGMSHFLASSSLAIMASIFCCEVIRSCRKQLITLNDTKPLSVDETTAYEHIIRALPPVQPINTVS